MAIDIFVISTPIETEFLGYSGEHTSILYASAVMWNEIIAGRVRYADGSQVTTKNVKYFAWRSCNSLAWNELREQLSLHRPRVVAVSLCTASSKNALRIAQIVKELSPKTLVIFGGPHEDEIRGSGPAGAELSTFVDISVAGEGEFALHYLVSSALQMGDVGAKQFVNSAARRVHEIKELPGRGCIVFRGAPPLSVTFSSRLPNHLPRIPRALLIRDRPHLARGFSPIASVEETYLTAQVLTERGCAWRCAFCAEWRGYYARQLEDVIEEIEEALELGYEAVWFEDSTFLNGFGAGTPKGNQPRLEARRHFVSELVRFMSRKNIEWGCQTRVDTIDPQMLKEMRDAGCSYMYLGAESASDGQLDEMRKQQSKSEIRKALKHLRDVGIRIGLSTLFGMPSHADPFQTNENEASFSESIRFFAHEIRKGGIVTISRNITAYYPGAIRTSTLNDSSRFDFWQGLPLANENGISCPWNRFEDGAGHHADNMTVKLAEHIVERGDQQLGPWVIKSYIHGTPDHRAPTTVDLVGYTRTSTERSNISPNCRDVRVHHSFVAGLESSISGKCFCQQRVYGRPQVLVVGMHCLEAIRRLAYLRRPADCPSESSSEFLPVSWWPIWDVQTDEQLIDRFRGKDLEGVRVAVIPKVLPESGRFVDMRSVERALSEHGFRGSLIVDCSDSIADLSWREADAPFSHKTTWLYSHGRVFRGPIGGCVAVSGTTPAESRQHFVSSIGAHDNTASERCTKHLMERLSLLESNIEILSVRGECAPHILAVRFPRVDQFALVERLWRDHGVLATFIGPLNIVRFQTHEEMSRNQLDDAVSVIAKVLPTCRGHFPAKATASVPRSCW